MTGVGANEDNSTRTEDNSYRRAPQATGPVCSMPSGKAAGVREIMATLVDRTNPVPEESRRSKTGYTNVIEVSGKFQARLQVKGDGRGGLQKRRQVAIPGLFDTAKEAAEMLAILEKAGPENLWPGSIPPKQDKQHKPREQLSRPMAERMSL